MLTVRYFTLIKMKVLYFHNLNWSNTLDSNLDDVNLGK